MMLSYGHFHLTLLLTRNPRKFLTHSGLADPKWILRGKPASFMRRSVGYED